MSFEPQIETIVNSLWQSGVFHAKLVFQFDWARVLFAQFVSENRKTVDLKLIFTVLKKGMSSQK